MKRTTNIDKIAITARGKEIMFGLQLQKQSKLRKSDCLPQNLTQRTTLVDFSKSIGQISARSQITPFTFKMQRQNLDKKSVFGSSQKQNIMHLRFLNCEILKETDNEEGKKHNKFLNQKANIISRKLLTSLQTLQNYNRIQQQKDKTKCARVQCNVGATIDQGRNYINRIIHRHKDQQKRYRIMLRKMRNKENLQQGQI